MKEGQNTPRFFLFGSFCVRACVYCFLFLPARSKAPFFFENLQHFGNQSCWATGCLHTYIAMAKRKLSSHACEEHAQRIGSRMYASLLGRFSELEIMQMVVVAPILAICFFISPLFSLCTVLLRWVQRSFSRNRPSRVPIESPPRQHYLAHGLARFMCCTTFPLLRSLFVLSSTVQCVLRHFLRALSCSLSYFLRKRRFYF